MLPARKLNGQNWLPDFFNDFFENNSFDRIRTFSPAVNVMECQNEYKLEMAVPGMTKDDVKIHLNKDGNLVIEMEKKQQDKEEKKDKRYIRREFSYSKFHQTMILPENAEKDKIQACVKDGVLHVEVPKAQEEKVEKENRIIEVK